MYQHCRSFQKLMTHHHFTRWNRPFSVSKQSQVKVNKAAGPYNIPAEVIQYGGRALHRRLHNLSLTTGPPNVSPQQWKNANIILVYMQKGDGAECCNSHGFSFSCVVGKVLAKIMLTRLLKHVVDLGML